MSCICLFCVSYHLNINLSTVIHSITLDPCQNPDDAKPSENCTRLRKEIYYIYIYYIANMYISSRDITHYLSPEIFNELKLYPTRYIENVYVLCLI